MGLWLPTPPLRFDVEAPEDAPFFIFSTVSRGNSHCMPAIIEYDLGPTIWQLGLAKIIFAKMSALLGAMASWEGREGLGST